MSVDVTAQFRALAPLDAAVSGRQESARPGKVSADNATFDLEALELLHGLVEMEAMLREVRPQYLRPRLFLRAKGVRMPEKDKDEFDADVVELAKSYSVKIDALRDMTDAFGGASMRIEHQREVVTYLLERLKSVANETKRMQKQRYNQPFLLSSRLLPEAEREALETLEDKLKAAAIAKAKREAETPPRPKQTLPSSPTPRSPKTDERSVSSKVPRRPAAESARPTPKPAKPFVLPSQNEELEFTEEEDRRFRMENVQLQRHFQHNLEDAKKMESKMAEISNLMGQFADKIMEQQTDIELIHQHAQETKTNITQSNRILEHTQNIGRGYGFMIFCFYLGFSVLLHLLHYFNN